MMLSGVVTDRVEVVEGECEREREDEGEIGRVGEWEFVRCMVWVWEWMWEWMRE